MFIVTISLEETKVAKNICQKRRSKSQKHKSIQSVKVLIGNEPGQFLARTDQCPCLCNRGIGSGAMLKLPFEIPSQVCREEALGELLIRPLSSSHDRGKGNGRRLLVKSLSG